MPAVYSGNDTIGYSSTNLVTQDNTSTSPYTSSAVTGSGDPSAARLSLAGLTSGGLNNISSIFRNRKFFLIYWKC